MQHLTIRYGHWAINNFHRSIEKFLPSRARGKTNLLMGKLLKTMKRPKKTIFALLGIVASVGYASLIVTPPRGYQVALSEEEFRRLRVPLPKQGDEFSHDVFLYRALGCLPSHNFEAELMTRCGLGLTEKQIQADYQAIKAKRQAMKERDTRVIAEVKRQEAQEARLKGNPGTL